jgi:hypothetical protein
MDINLDNSSDFGKNRKKHPELSKRTGGIISQRETNNLQTAITAEELLVSIEADIREIYKKKIK